MIKFLCTKRCLYYPCTEKGKTYKGEYDKNGYIWLIDEFWIENEISEFNFNINIHGSYVSRENEKYLKIIK